MNNQDNTEEEAPTPARRIVSGSARLVSNAGLAVSVRMATHFSLVHIQSAALFARHCAVTERAFAGTNDETGLAEHRAYVTGAIFHSVAFLEANVNELYDATLQNSPLVRPLAAKSLNEMAALWKHALSGRTRFSMLDKYQLALELNGQERFPKTASHNPPARGSFADIQELTSLRDTLMHYQPLWEGDREEKAVRRLRAQLQARFANHINPLVPGNSYFLHLYLSHACAVWAVESSLAFADAFYARLGIQPPYEHLRGQLGTE
jgi:hypothetical protein